MEKEKDVDVKNIKGMSYIKEYKDVQKIITVQEPVYDTDVINMYEKVLTDLLKKAIAENCYYDNKKDTYYLKIDWDYNDNIDPKTMIEFLDVMNKTENNYKDAKSLRTAFEWYFYNNLMDYDYDSETIDYFLDNVKEYIENNSTTDFMNWLENEKLQDINLIDLCYNNGFNGIDMNLTELLEQSTFSINIMFATPYEQDSDMNNIVASYMTLHDYDRLLENKDVLADVSNFDNMITYLLHQYGCNVKECLNYYVHPAENTNLTFNFLSSLCDEIRNFPEYSMCELTAIASVNGNELLRLFDWYNNTLNDVADNGRDWNNAYLELDKSIMIGLFNQWQGTGSDFEIELPSNLIVPKQYVREIKIEGGKEKPYDYTVDNVYGFTWNCYKEACISYTFEKPLAETCVQNDFVFWDKYLKDLLALIRKYEPTFDDEDLG